LEIYFIKALYKTDSPNIASNIYVLNYNNCCSDNYIYIIILYLKDNV
jgi:hypothetical protein